MNNIFFEKYQKEIISILNKKIKELNITQNMLASQTNISQSTISKLLSNKANITLEQLVNICLVLQIDVSSLVSFEKMGLQLDNSIYSMNLIPENDNFISDVQRPAFKGYIGNKYFIYFYPTISKESQMIHGELEFYSSEEDRCKINLKIYTGKKDISGNDITKEYTGDMIISIPLSSCYCILICPRIGEICFLSFHHMFLFNQDLICRVGAVLTISSGASKRPTLHRMLISKYEFDLEGNNNDLKFLQGQLKLNNSEIIIPEKAFDNFEKKPELEDFFDIFFSSATLKNYYTIDEAKLLDSKISTILKVQGISLLREMSIANKYNKVSSKTDEFIFEYISELKERNT